ncbi:hypothetical protein [Minisyncoccus archaeiphilus]
MIESFLEKDCSEKCPYCRENLFPDKDGKDFLVCYLCGYRKSSSSLVL